MSKKLAHTVVAHFDERVREFKRWLLHDDSVLGDVVDMVARVEFQARGYPHAHILVWVRDAPDVHTEEGMQVALDEYIDEINVPRLSLLWRRPRPRWPQSRL